MSSGVRPPRASTRVPSSRLASEGAAPGPRASAEIRQLASEERSCIDSVNEMADHGPGYMYDPDLMADEYRVRQGWSDPDWD